MIEAFFELWEVLSRNALRTILTGLSVAWGMFMLVVLLGAGSGLQHGAEWEFRDDAQNSIWIGGVTSVLTTGIPVVAALESTFSGLPVSARSTETRSFRASAPCLHPRLPRA